MKIIPVIDLKNGQAVHAKQGFRKRYQPLATRLCPTGDPFACASALLSVYPFDTIYIADLDALMSTGSNSLLIESLVEHFPDIVFWIDQGLNSSISVGSRNRPWVPVLGTESLTESSLPRLALQQSQTVLSLDFSSTGLLGPKVLIENDKFWPERIIVMNLANVGGNVGPNWQRFEYFRRNWPDRQFIAAGGIRHEEDLDGLASLGFVGVLLASALHRGQITAPVIARYMSDSLNE